MKKSDTKKTVEKSSVTRTPSTANLKYFILAGCLLVVLFLVGYFVTSNSSDLIKSKIPVQNIEDVECLKKGNICTAEELQNGIKVRYKVNKNDTYEFYVISNDDKQINLMLDRDIINQHVWGFQLTNTKGPGYSLFIMNDELKEWTNVPYLNYTYVDFGYQYYVDVCVDKTKEDKEFDCSKYVGYKSFVVKEGDAAVNYNAEPPEEEDPKFVTTKILEDVKVRARYITLEEVTSLYIPKKGLPKWLIENVRLNRMYWTMSSMPYANDGYDIKAYTIINRDGKADLGGKEVSNGENPEDLEDDYNAGLRPVITLNKK